MRARASPTGAGYPIPFGPSFTVFGTLNGKFFWPGRHVKQSSTNWPIVNGLHELQADAAEFAIASECGTFRLRHLFVFRIGSTEPQAANGYFRLMNGGVWCGTWHISSNMGGNGSYFTAKVFLSLCFDWSNPCLPRRPPLRWQSG